MKSKGNVLRLDVYKKEILKLCMDCLIFLFWGILTDYIYVLLKRNSGISVGNAKVSFFNAVV